MSIRSLCIFLIITFVTQVNSQNPSTAIYHKLKINITGRNIQDLTNAGLETDHGTYVKNRFFTSDFSEEEIGIIKNLGFEYEILISDVAKYYADPLRTSEIKSGQLQLRNNCFATANSEYPYKTPSQYRPGSMGGYFTLKEMYDILDSMASRYPKLITLKQPIKDYKTINGNPIYYIKVSDNAIDDEANEPKVLYTALHHAREPNSLSQMIFFLWYVLENYETDPMVKKIVDQTQMYFIPCVNPDGYELNQKNNPQGGGLWRKNAWKDTLGDLKGVDLNRNYGHTWGRDNNGSSPNPNSLTFRGLSAFSEVETQAIRSFCLDHEFKIVLNYHTFGNFLIYPSMAAGTNSHVESLFNNLGRVINSENNFAFGTDLQTVGYSVNGDSDSWMFGENAEKNKIFAYTPEVGPAFWPASVDIEYLNKSCIWMNISAALLTLNYYEAEEIRTSNILDQLNKSIYVKLSRAGMQAGQAVVTLKSQNNNVIVINPKKWVSLDIGMDTVLVFDVEWNSGQRFEDGFSFELKVENDGLERTKFIKKTWSEYPFQPLFADRSNDLNNFQTNGWSLTESTFKSAPHSITDSPLGLYPPKYTSTITLINPIDLSTADRALLQFDAKWDIEDNYDYVQVSASKDNKDFIPLCGLYTNPGTKDQTLSSPVYDGVQNEWVREEIDLSAFARSKNLWIRFTIKTDDYEQRDGFYFDNLEVKVAVKPTPTDDAFIEKIYIQPNTISDAQHISIQGLNQTEVYHISIYSLQGHLIYTSPVSAIYPEISLSTLTGGLYIYDIKQHNNKTAGRGKLLILQP